MSHKIAEQIVSRELKADQKILADALADDSLSWEEVSAIASAQNAHLFRTIEAADRVADRIIEDSVDHAIHAGIFMQNEAMNDPSFDPDFIPDLVEGVNALVKRVHDQASEGRSIRMDYMNPTTRKQLFLVEAYTRAGRNKK